MIDKKEKKGFSWKHIRIVAAAVFMIVVVLAFCGNGKIAPRIAEFQLGPSLMSLFVTFSAGALVVALAVLLLTFLFGRFYCSVFCPLGIFQDIVAFIFRSRRQPQKNHAGTRYVVFGIVFGLLLGGQAVGFMLLDPYSNFGRMFTTFSLGATLPLVVVAALAVWKRRLFCVAVCPVGTLLGVAAKYGVFRLGVDEGKCVKCRKCGRVCPTGAIDVSTGTIDNERCIRCLNCVPACSGGAIGFFGRPRRPPVAFSASRRAFIMQSSAWIAGLAAGMGGAWVLAKTGGVKIVAAAQRFGILPPGAGNAERFAGKCTACQLCTSNCPSKIIVPAKSGYGAVSLDLSGEGHCLFECNRCSEVCPTGAILPLTLAAKQKTKIAQAKLKLGNCLVVRKGKRCGRCARACPTGAITLRGNGVPRLNLARCVGCGACRVVCPPGVLHIQEIERQATIDSETQNSRR